MSEVLEFLIASHNLYIIFVYREKEKEKKKRAKLNKKAKGEKDEQVCKYNFCIWMNTYFHLLL